MNGCSPQRIGRTATTAKHILLADDDSMVRAALTAVLESEGYVVDQAQDGREAVTRAVRQPPDLVLLDLNMPHVDGWAAFSQIEHFRPLVPVIVITARPRQYSEASRLGVDALMEKPLDIPVLLRAIRKLIYEPESRRITRVTDRDFTTRYLAKGNGRS